MEHGDPTEKRVQTDELHSFFDLVKRKLSIGQRRTHSMHRRPISMHHAVLYSMLMTVTVLVQARASTQPARRSSLFPNEATMSVVPLEDGQYNAVMNLYDATGM